MYHLVNLTPIGQSANVAVVNEKICLYLAGEMVVIFDLLFRIIFVNGVKLDTALTTPVDGVLEELTLSYAPKNELVVFFNEHLQCFGCKWNFVSYVWVSVRYNCSVKVYCYNHTVNLFLG